MRPTQLCDAGPDFKDFLTGSDISEKYSVTAPSWTVSGIEGMVGRADLFRSGHSFLHSENLISRTGALPVFRKKSASLTG